ncbi:hypothetical protein NQT66_09610 [Cellulophaga baltica]|uniref:hypothetical protein n=1 Tax=Cellulophaga baltica TaxID=76594 RepID=UPI002147523B|nr:hypothetical protein [Cellulophaga baltica]MCR1025061.1 hypothetical protein [Cellulophaga baltica]
MGKLTINSVSDSNVSYEGSSTEMDEFIPIVRVLQPEGYNTDQEGLFFEKDENGNDIMVDLLTQTEASQVSFSISELTTSLNKPIMPFLVLKAGPDFTFGKGDDDGYISLELSLEKDKYVEVEGATASIKLKGDAHYSDKVLVKWEDKIDVEIDITTKKSIEFYIRFLANDDKDRFEGDYENLFCGCFKVIFIAYYKDVFNLEEVDLLFKENKRAKEFNKKGDFAGNGYCINTADRGLGAILKDTDNFYKEPNYIKLGGNGVRLESGSIRAAIIAKLGYIKSYIEIRTNNYNTFDKPTKLNSSLSKKILEEINERRGYHLYYFSMHGDYHVMLLLINYTDPKEPTFRILDQGYVDSGSNSRFIEFAKMDSVFLIIAEAFWESKNKHAKNILLWRIQRK